MENFGGLRAQDLPPTPAPLEATAPVKAPAPCPPGGMASLDSRATPHHSKQCRWGPPWSWGGVMSSDTAAGGPAVLSRQVLDK